MKPLPESQTVVPMLLGGPQAVDVAPTAPRPLTLPLPALRLLSDARLARLASAGDRAAFGVIFHRYHQELHRYCVSILRNAEDAGDALQSTMLRALNALEGDTREIALRPWLYRIAHNESITLLRRHRRAEVDAELSVPARLDGEASAELRAQLNELLGDLRELPERQRGALVMRELGGLDYSEIAAVLETTPAGAKQATYDARSALHELAKGREMDCALVCTAVSHGDGRALRGRALRAHLRACGDCRDFRSAIADRRSKLAELTPVMPSAAAAGLLERVLASTGGGIGGAGLFTGVGVPAVLKSLTALVVAAALGTGALRAVDSGSGHGSPGAVRAAPVVRPSVPTAPARPAHSVPRSHRADRGQAGRGAAHRTRRADGTHGPAHDVAPPSSSGGTRHAAGATSPGAAADASAGGPAARSRRRGPLRHFVSPSVGDYPIRQGVSVISHADLPSLAEVRDALPVKVPPLPIHPKRKRAQ
jgi:RNA polymerase sigma factor (sigma-70 family)